MFDRLRAHLIDWRSFVAAGVVVSTAVGLSPGVANAVTTVTTGGPFSYTEQDPPMDIGAGTSVAGGNFYDGQYVDFEIAGADASEHLALRSVSTPVVTDAVVSVVGTAVYVGDGATAVPIGSIDSVSDGQGGTKLRVNFGSDFRNAGFETGDIAPWNTLAQRIDLGVTEVAGFVSQDTSTYDPKAGNDDPAPSSLGTYTVAPTSSNPPGPTEGTYALGLSSSGIVTAGGYDVIHGPAVYSAPFDAAGGQALSFDWRAFAGGDAYSVFGYLLNTSTGAQTEVLDTFTSNTSGTSNWATVNVTVPSTGTYRFVFVSGTYDASGGRVAGASLYVDNFQVVSASFVDDAMVSDVAALLTYRNTSDDPPASRTVTVTARSVSDGADGGDIIVNITPVNDPPVGAPLDAIWENQIGDDTFPDITGTASFTDADDTSHVFGVIGGTTGTFTFGTDTYDRELVGTYATLYVDTATGDYRLVGDDAAIEAVLSDPASETFTLTADDGEDVGSAGLRLGILLPPAPRNVVGTPGDGQVTVEWDPPADTTGILGYDIVAAPGGATCSTIGAGSTSCVVTGLTNGTPYTFVATPTTAAGPGTSSLPSNAVTPIGPPEAPSGIAATPGDGRALVSWDPPVNDGGSAITSYTVTSSPGGGSCTTTTTSCTILGLALGTTYTFTVHATNAIGDSPESGPTQLLLKSASTTSLGVSASTIDGGDSVTLTATVPAGTGTVEFFDGTTSLGTATVASGTASIATTALNTGVRSVTAVYGGDSDYYSSTSAPQTVTVRTYSSTSVAASDATPGEGASVTFTATITGDSPTGTVEFFDGTTSLGTATITAGTATLSTSSLAVGDHTVSVVYGGDALNVGSTSKGTDITVLTNAAAALSTSATTPADGDSVTFTATITGDSPTGTVEFFDGTTSLGTATIIGSTATLSTDALTPGVHNLTAVYRGDAANTGATSTKRKVTVLTNSAAALATSATTPAEGDTVTLTATITGDSPSGTVEFVDGTTSLGTATIIGSTATLSTDALTPGVHNLTAVYRGDAANTGATSTKRKVTVLTNADVTIESSDTAVAAGDTVAMTATITGDSPSGTVEFFDGTTSLGTATITGGTATLSTDALTPGVHNLTAVYRGDAANTAATSDGVDVTVLTNSTVAVSTPKSTVLTTATPTITATVGGDDPTGTVTFFDGLVQIGTADVRGGVAVLTTRFTTPGRHRIAATYDGDASNTPSTSSALTVTAAAPPTAVLPDRTSVTGSQIPVTGSGFEPGSTVEVFLGGANPILIGTFTADANGSISGDVTLPSSANGTTSLELRGTDAAGDSSVATTPLQINHTLPRTGGDGSQVIQLGLGLLLIGLVLSRVGRRRTPRVTG